MQQQVITQCKQGLIFNFRAFSRSMSPEINNDDYFELNVTYPYCSLSCPTIILVDSDSHQFFTCKMRVKSKLDNEIWSSIIVRWLYCLIFFRWFRNKLVEVTTISKSMVRIVMTLANRLIQSIIAYATFSSGRISKTLLPEMEIFVMFLLSKKLMRFTRELNFIIVLILRIVKTVTIIM